MKTDRLLRILIVISAIASAYAERVYARDSADITPRVECSASLRSVPSFVWRGASGRGYSDDAPAMWEEGILRVDVSEGNCPFALVVDTNATLLAGASGSIQMILSDSPGGVDLGRTALDPISSPFSGTGSLGEAQEFGIYLSLPEGQTVRAGDYATSVPVRLFLMESGMPVQVDEAMIDVSAMVGARLSVDARSFVSGVADVSLGDLSQGFSHSLDFDIEGNTPVSVSVNSANRGSLKHDKADISIPYRAILEGRLLDLSAGGDMAMFDLDPTRARTLSMEIEGDPPQKPVAGVYADTLTLVFRSEM